MSLIDELQSTVTTIAERAGGSIVGIGRGNRGSGIVIGDGRVFTLSPGVSNFARAS